MTAWMLRFISNCKARRNKLKRRSGPLVTEEITTGRTYWVRRVQRADQASLQSPGWKLVEDEDTGVLKCQGRVKGYRPTYLPGGSLAEKVVAHVHNQIMHLGVANTMASVRESWWIPKLRARVKKTIKRCNVCKVFSTRPYEASPTSALLEYRTEGSRPFEVTGVDFAGPLSYRVGKEELRKVLNNHLHVREVKSTPFRSNKDTNGGRIPEETERVHLAPNEASCNHLRQCRSLQDHSRLDQSYQEEREDAELLSERGNSLAV